VLNRQKIILFMLKQAGGAASRLLLTKWAFLLAHETASKGGSAFYQFVPYQYGPYSFSLAREINTLVREGLIEERCRTVRSLTPAGFHAEYTLPVAIEHDAADIMSKYGAAPLEPLLASIYGRYPWFTVNSKDKRKRAQTRPVASLAVYTLGYEGLMVEGFLNHLLRSGVQCLVDVRNNPISRRYGFHKSTLSRLCAYLGITYRHIPELGITPESRARLRNTGDYQALFNQYRHDILPRQTAAVRQVAETLTAHPSALVCMEADPECCRRSHLAAAVAKLTGLPVKHLAIAQ